MLSSFPWLKRGFPLVAVLAVVAVAGCESPAWVRSLNDAFALRPAQPDAKVEEEHRREFQSSRNRSARQWLLANRVQTGMTFEEVSRVLGEKGTFEPNSNWVRKKAEGYRVGDDVYSFGPDSKGETLYLAFRDDALVNFNPDDFRSGPSK